MPTTHDSNEGQTQHMTQEETRRAEFEQGVFKKHFWSNVHFVPGKQFADVGRQLSLDELCAKDDKGNYVREDVSAMWFGFCLCASQSSATIANLGECDKCGSPYSHDPTDGGTICVKCQYETIARLDAELLAMTECAKNHDADRTKYFLQLAAAELSNKQYRNTLEFVVANSNEKDVGGGDLVIASCEAREYAISALAQQFSTEALDAYVAKEASRRFLNDYDITKLPAVLISLSAKLFGHGGMFWEVTIDKMPDAVAAMQEKIPAWQPIETAPKDGTIVDLLIDGERITDCYWGLPNHSCGEQGRYCDSDWHSLTDYWVCSIFNEQLGEGATHWMPLPPSPANQEE